MTTLSQAQSAGQAASYHSSDNYHTKDGITEVGHWKGQGAEMLGLEGEIDQKQYVEVLNGYAPGSLAADQVKSLEKIDKEGENLQKEAEKLKEDSTKEGYAEKKEELDERIKNYNEKRDDFHKDVKTGGLHSQIKELKAMGSKDPEIQSQIKDLEKEMKAFAASNPQAQLIRDGYDKESGVAMHRAGWDMTFSASKSISIMALEAGDNKLIDLHKSASDTTYALAEKYLAQGLEYDENNRRVAVNTGNMIAAEYVHYTSRAPEKDSTPDPQLHSHMFTMNLTNNGDGKWRSLEVDKIFKNQMHLGQIYQNELAYQMRQETDYGLTWKNSGSNMAVEIKGVSQDLIDLRSGRTKQIEALTAAKEKALGRPLTGEEKDDITKTSRVSKGEQNVDELRDYWKDTREELGHSTESLHATTANQVHDKTIASSAEDAIKIAVTTLSDGQATFSELELLAEASRAAQGVVSIEHLQAALKENTRISAKELTNQTETFVLGVENGQNVYASAKMLVAEANIEKAVRDGKGAGALMGKEEFSEAFKKVEENKKAEAAAGGKEYFNLTEGQNAILTHIATSEDRYIGVMGDAGVGKTTSLERLTQTVEVLKETLGDKFEIHGLAPTNLAAATIERDAGIASRTVDSFIHKPTESTEGKQQVYLVDECSMLDTVKMAKLYEIAEKNDAKLVNIGDIKQHPPVGAGAQFDRMHRTGQMEFAYATESMRHQTEITKEVAESFKKIDTLHKGLDALEAKGKLIQNENKEELVKSLVSNLASDYTDAHEASLIPRGDRPADLRAGLDDVLAIVGTNVERQMINTALRPLLQDAGVIGKEDHKINTLEDKRLDNTAAQFSGNYAVGDTLIHHKGDGQIKQGFKNKVVAVNRESNELKLGWHTKGGQYREKWISGNQATEFSTYKDVEKSFSVGDKIAFEGNDAKIGVKNNETARITEIRADGKWIVDKGGKEIEIDPKSFPFISHGWTMTSHKSQGQGIGREHALADTESGMINRESGYVVMTRAKHDMTVYTDNRQKLEAQYKKEQLKLNAADKIDVKSFAGAKFNDTDREKQSDTHFTTTMDNKEILSEGAPKQRTGAKEARTMVRDNRHELALAHEAKREQKLITSNIEKMRNDAKKYDDKAFHHLKESRNIKQNARSRGENMYEVARAGAMAKDIKGGIRYQQLVKTEAKMMEKGEIDLHAERNFVLKQPGGTKEMRAGYLAGQARSQAMMNQMVKDGILIRDPRNNERYELAVSRQEYAAYRNSERAHETKADLAQGAWNRAIGDKLFEQGKANADATMIAGGGWNPREAIARVKLQGLYNKDTEEIFNRLTARYDRLSQEGLVHKVGSEYKAVNNGAMKSYVGSRDDRLMSYRGEGENVEQYREMKKFKEENGIIQRGVKHIDKSIIKSTHVNRETVKNDIKDAYEGAAYVFNAKGVFGHVAAGAVGVVMGTIKTMGRGIAGAAYRMTKEVVKDATDAVKDTLDMKMDKEIDTEKAVDVMTKDERFEQFQQKLHASAGIDKDGEKPELIKEDEKKIDPNTGLEKVDIEQVNKEIDELTGKDKEDSIKEDKADDEKEPAKSFEERLEEAAGGRKLDEIEENDKQEKQESAERNEEEERNNAGDEREVEKEDERDDR